MLGRGNQVKMSDQQENPKSRINLELPAAMVEQIDKFRSALKSEFRAELADENIAIAAAKKLGRPLRPVRTPGPKPILSVSTAIRLLESPAIRALVPKKRWRKVYSLAIEGWSGMSPDEQKYQSRLLRERAGSRRSIQKRRNKRRLTLAAPEAREGGGQIDAPGEQSE
jgi:hypothetical protein